MCVYILVCATGNRGVSDTTNRNRRPKTFLLFSITRMINYKRTDSLVSGCKGPLSVWVPRSHKALPVTGCRLAPLCLLAFIAAFLL